MTQRKTKSKVRPLRYFYYDGDLHKKIHINRGDDVITAWNYPKGKMMKYIYSAVRRNGEQAFTTKQVSAMVGRSHVRVTDLIYQGRVKKPQSTYGLDEKRNFYAYYWCEQDIMDLHSYLKTVSRGRPRKDGRITPAKMPTASEVRAMIRQNTVFYVKDADGNFVPTWDAERF